MSATTPVSKTTTDTIPDSLIDILCVRAKWERSVMAEIRQAHGKKDVKQVMVLLTKLFNEGPGTIKGKDHESRA
jgi:hypothetical protein